MAPGLLYVVIVRLFRFKLPIPTLILLVALVAAPAPSPALAGSRNHESHRNPEPFKPKQLPTEAELQPLRDFLRGNVQIMRRPITVYHWVDGDAGLDELRDATRSNTPAGLKYVQAAAETYWDNSTEHPRYMYGPGFYAAVDPAATREYGGGKHWVLVEMKLPAGFRMINLVQRAQLLTRPVIQVLRQLGCFPDRKRGYTFDSLFKPNMGREDCKMKLQEIIGDELKVDGFAYPYKQASTFHACEGSERPRRLAFVITGSRWADRDAIRIYNQHTLGKADREDRLRIQSMFYKAREPRDEDQLEERLSNMTFPEYPSYQYQSNQMSCDENHKCTGKVIVRNEDLDHDVDLEQEITLTPPAWPVNIEAPSAHASSAEDGIEDESGPPELLWRDLKGTQTDAKVEEWMRQNLWGCNAQSETITLANFQQALDSHCLQEGKATAKQLEDAMAPVLQAVKGP